MEKSKNEEKLANLARNSRVILIVIQYISNILIPDHQAEVFHYPKLNEEYSFLDRIILHSLSGFLRWDAQYFMNIVIYGYTYENTVAFFPLYPITVGLVTRLIQYVIPFISLEATALLVSLLINIILFQLSVKSLYKLTTLVFDEQIGYNTAVSFCFNPASIFFIAPYSECMFSFFTFQAILKCLLLFKKYSKCNAKFYITDGLCLLQISMSTLTRSNGVINIGFFIYVCICLCKTKFPQTNFLCQLRHIFKYLFITITGSVICIIPFILYQIYCYRRFCNNFAILLPTNVIDYAIQNNFVLPGQFYQHNQTWCYKNLPLAYSYVQNHYWNVGFLKYFEVRQIPNFILAAPIITLLMLNCYLHVQNNFANVFDLFNLDKIFTIKEKKFEKILFTTALNVFVIHALVLSTFCILFVHIQVSTRMLCSACPLFYWYCVHYFEKDTFINIIEHSFWSSLPKKGLIITMYFGLYFLLGTIMFCNFLPWT